MTKRFLSIAEAEGLSADIAAELDLIFRGSQESYGEIMGAVGRALDKASVGPGDVGFCWPEKRWDAICEWWKVYDSLGDVEKCTHPDYREGHCPKGEK